MGVFDFFRKKKENRVEEEINDCILYTSRCV